MSLDADQIVDRRRMRRKLTFWRVTAVLVAVGAMVGGAVMLTGVRGSGLPPVPPARSPASPSTGLIRGNRQRVEALERLSEFVECQGGDRSYRQPGRHDGRLRSSSTTR